MTLSLLFGAWPYLAGLLLLAGVTLRAMLHPTGFDTPELRLTDAVAQLGGGWLRRAALAALLLVHLVAVAMPHRLLSWTHGAQYLYLWEGLAVAAAGIVLAAAAKQAWRQLVDASGSRLAQVADTIFLALLLVGALSGVLMAVLHRWASAWGVLLLTPYVQSVLAGHPSVEQLGQVPFLARVHILSLVSLAAVFPFSRFAVLAIGPLQAGAVVLLRFVAAAWLPCRRTLESGLRWASLTLGLSAEEE